MANKTYISINKKAKQIKQLYCSIDGKAKRIKKLYGSVDGEAKVIYDTVTVMYVRDNGTTDSTDYVFKYIGKGTKAERLDGLHWYRSDGTEWDFSKPVNSTMILYEAVYKAIDFVTFDGNHYVPTDIKIPRTEMDIDMYPLYATDVASQRRVFAIRGTPTVEMYVNGDGYWNHGIGNNASSIRWSARANNVKAKVNERVWFRLNLTGSNHYSQVWSDSAGSGSWSDVGAMTQNTTTANLVIGGVEGKVSGTLPFKGRLPKLGFVEYSCDCYKRTKGGTTVEGYVWSQTKKFYPLVIF